MEVLRYESRGAGQRRLASESAKRLRVIAARIPEKPCGQNVFPKKPVETLWKPNGPNRAVQLLAESEL